MASFYLKAYVALLINCRHKTHSNYETTILSQNDRLCAPNRTNKGRISMLCTRSVSVILFRDTVYNILEKERFVKLKPN